LRRQYTNIAHAPPTTDSVAVAAVRGHDEAKW